MSRLTGAMMLVAFLVGCGDGVFRVTVLFPDEEARQRTQTVHIMVLVPAERSACDELLSGRAEPGSVGYEIEDRVTFAYPSGEGGRSLQNIGPGRRLFFAQALDEANAVILLGCVDLVAGRGGEGEVTIVLTWKCRLTNGGVETCDGVDNDCDGGIDDGSPIHLCPAVSRAQPVACTGGRCFYDCQTGWYNADADWSNGCECRPTRGNVEWCDGLDNDCDGLRDNPTCRPCTSDADCTDASACLDNACHEGRCSSEPLSNGHACEDGLFCSVQDVCVDGLCLGQPRDCSALADDCHEGVCDEAAGACLPQPLAAGAICDDGLFCTVDDFCDGQGSCAGQARDCSHLDEPCRVGVCQEAAGQCVVENKDVGTPCDDGDFCTIQESCLSGVCTGQARDCGQNTHCAAGACLCAAGFENCDLDWSNGCECSCPTCKTPTCEGLSCACVNIPAGEDPFEQCQAVGCGLDGWCDGAGACRVPAVGEDPNNFCPPATCKSGACNGSGACGDLPAGSEGNEGGGNACQVCRDCDGHGSCVRISNQKDIGCDSLCRHCWSGLCTYVSSGQDPYDECPNDAICRTGYCDGGGGCQVVEDGTFCQTASGQAGYCSAGSCIPL